MPQRPTKAMVITTRLNLKQRGSGEMLRWMMAIKRFEKYRIEEIRERANINEKFVT